MRITRVYTRTGDRGTTRLVGGAERRKNDVRIEAYGTVDELNAVLGLARTFGAQADGAGRERIESMLAQIQNELFDVGADLATAPADRWPGMHLVGDEEVTRLEGWIDALNEDLPPLKDFILPGGGPVGAFLHQARTVCRRGERALVSLIDVEPDTGEGCLRYLNRLSDLLFVLCRVVNRDAGVADVLWQKGRSL